MNDSESISVIILLYLPIWTVHKFTVRVHAWGNDVYIVKNWIFYRNILQPIQVQESSLLMVRGWPTAEPLQKAKHWHEKNPNHWFYLSP